MHVPRRHYENLILLNIRPNTRGNPPMERTYLPIRLYSKLTFHLRSMNSWTR